MRPSQRSGRGREALSEVREGSESPPREPGGVWSLSWRAGRRGESLPKVREGSGGPPVGPGGPPAGSGVIGKPALRSVRGR